jgi:omega-6 fatty acid desaturase (delta-12 desaturase)
LALPQWRRFGYRLYRNPLVLFVLGPAYLFIVQHRLPIRLAGSGWQPWFSTMATNAGIALIIVVMMWLVGVGPFLLVHLPITLLSASIGGWLFYVQHQFEDTFWAESRIPYYRLPHVLSDHPELKAVGRLTLIQSLGCVRLVLWDESRRRLISFRELRQARHAASQR